MPAIGIMLGLANAGQGGAFTPVSLSDLTAWWDASDASSVTLNGSDVASIADKSGNSRSAAQGTAAVQPAYNTSTGINSKNVIAFTAANSDALALSNSLGIMRNRPGNTIVGVARIPTLGSNQRLFTIVVNTSVGPLFSLFISTSNVLQFNSRRVTADATSGLTSTATISAATPFFFAASVDYTTGGVFLQVDATTRTQTAAWVTGAASEDLNHGSAPLIGTQGTNTLNGDIAEMITYGRALTTQEISDLRTRYLKAKWALA